MTRTTIERRAKAVADKYTASEGAYALQKAIELEMIKLLNEARDVINEAGARLPCCVAIVMEIEEGINALRD